MKKKDENEIKNNEVKAEETEKAEVKEEEAEKTEVKEEVKEQPKKEEAKVENNFKQASTTTETKPSFFKKHGLAIFISLVVIALAVAAVVLFMNMKGGNPEDVFKTYVEARKEGKSDKLMDITDFKGVIAWSKSDNNSTKFIEKYNSIKNEDVDSYKDKIKETYDSALSILNNFGGFEVVLKNIEKPEDLGNDIYKVKGQITLKVLGMEQDQTITLITYRGKFIGEVYE